MDLRAWQAKLDHLRGRQRQTGWRALTALLVLAAAVVIIHVALDPVATHYTRKALHEMDGYRGDFQRVHVTILSPGYDITHLNIWEHPGGSAREPLVYARRVHVGFDLSSLLRGHIVGRVRVDHPKISIIKRPAPAAAQEKEKEKKPAHPPDLTAQLAKVTELRVDRVEVVGGEVLFRDMSEPRHPELWVHRIELTAENFATRPKLAHKRPATVAARGVLGKSGALSMFASADPFASPLSFAGKAELTGFQAAELYDLIQPKTGLQAPQGTVDVFVEMLSRGGEVTGGVKPVLKNVEVRSAAPGAWNRLKAWLADEVLDLFSDRVPERNAVATIIPIKGRLTDPDAQLWPTLLGVVRNAFVEGLTSGFAHLPPETAPEKQSPVKQAREALDKDKGPPKAQPEKKEKGR